MWIASCSGPTLPSAAAVSEEALSDAGRDPRDVHLLPSAGGRFIYHVATCAPCLAAHPNAYEEALVAVPA